MKYTYEKTIKELESDVKKAHSDELAKQATWELEKGKEDKLEKQIANCTLIAPIDGLVVYANDPNRMFGSNQSQIEEGATVRERQKVISIPDIGRMQVNAKVHESQIEQDQAQPQGARSGSTSFADQQLDGRRHRGRPPARRGQLLQLRHQGLHDPDPHPEPDRRPPAGHDGRGEDPGQPARERAERSGPGDPPVQWQGPRDQEGRRPVRPRRGDPRRLERQVRPGDQGAGRWRRGRAQPDLADERGGEARGVPEHQGRQEGLGKGEGEPGKGGPPGAAGKGGAPGKGGDAAKGKAKKGGRGGGGRS